VAGAHRLFYGTLTVAEPGNAPLEGASFIEEVRTAPHYRLFSLSGFPVLVDDPAGQTLTAQIWDVPAELWETIVAGEPAEMTPHAVELEDGRRIETLVGTLAFVENRGGVEVTEHGGWKAYRLSRRSHR